tara:strand:+ start:429 stop:608 length:180 start_codon:yes stop_codon:yes gene_type:complete
MSARSPMFRKGGTQIIEKKEGTDHCGYGCRLHRLIDGQSDDFTAENISFANGEGRYSPK